MDDAQGEFQQYQAWAAESLRQQLQRDEVMRKRDDEQFEAKMKSDKESTTGNELIIMFNMDYLKAFAL